MLKTALKQRIMNGFSNPGRRQNRVAWRSDPISLAASARKVSSLSGEQREGGALDSEQRNWKRTALRALIYAALFLLAMELTVDIARYGANVTPIWIASAILAWTLLSSPTRDWPIIVGFFVAAHIIRSIYVADAPVNELIYLSTNIGGPLLCAGLLRWSGNALEFEDRASVFRFLVIGGLVAPTLSAGVVAIGSFISPDRFDIADLGTWFLADALSYVVFLPIFCSFGSGAWRQLLAPRLRMKAIILLGILLAAQIAAWYMPTRLHNFFTIAAVPYYILIAFELGSAGASLAIAIVAVTMLGNGLLVPRVAGAPLNTAEYLLASQLYIAAVATCILPLVAALDEKNRLYESASRALAEAQSAWGELIAAEAHYRLLADNSRDLVMRLDLDGVVIFASPACRTISADVHELEGQEILDLVHEEDIPRVRSEMQTFISAGVVDRPQSIRMRLRVADGGWRQFDVSATLITSRGKEPEEIIATLREVLA
jgi:PAS domain S-box-containing protein